jgi:hypothetical protein
MRNIIIVVFIFTTGFFVSCSDETINDYPVDFTPASVIYGDSAKITQFVNNIYSFVPEGYNRLTNSSMVASATDEAVHAVRGSAAEKWGTGSWNPTLIHDNPFSSSYSGIRRTYVFEEQILPNIEDIVMTSVGRNLYYGQVLFLRALFNFELLKRFGGYPIVSNSLAANEDLNIPRSTYDQCTAYIVGLCDQAASLLPVSYANNQLGRATRGAALALKARLLLYSASPLFNDQSKSTDGLENGKYDPAKWEKAAEASAAVINLKVYDLYNSGTGYDAFFYTLLANKEIIFLRMAAANNTLEKLNGPVSITGGEGGTCPTLDLVNDYEMQTGIPFDWDNPAHAANPFANRDPRFGKSILYNGAKWMNNIIVETFEGGKDKIGNKATRTGFYLRKFLNVNARWNAPTGTTFHCFPLFRYGEVLLNYAEAMNEAYGPDVDPKGYGMTAREAVELIRKRAGLTGNTNLSLNVPAGDKGKMRDAIQHERRIELAFEEHRHLDLRRWKIAETVLNRPVSGLKITKNQDATFTYVSQAVEERKFAPKMYLYPFPQEEINRNKNLIQNTDW